MNNIIILCNYNEGKTGSLTKCLDSLEKNKIENTIIGIIDNGSKDNSYDIIKKYQQKKVIDYAIFNTINIGKAKALNSLLQFILKMNNIDINNTILWSIDSDIQLLDDLFVQKIDYIFEQHKNINCIGCDTINEYQKHTQRCVQNNNNFIKLDNLQFYNVSQYETQNSIQGLCGCVLILPLLNFITVNGYNQTLGKNKTSALYGGDDAVLLLNLYIKFPNTLFLCTKTLTVKHPETKDQNYKKWKTQQNNCMCFEGFSNNKLAEKGYFD